MFLLEIYLEQYHRFSFTEICYIKQSLFTDTVVLHTLPSMYKENKNIKGYGCVLQYSRILTKLLKR